MRIGDEANDKTSAAGDGSSKSGQNPHVIGQNHQNSDQSLLPIEWKMGQPPADGTDCGNHWAVPGKDGFPAFLEICVICGHTIFPSAENWFACPDCRGKLDHRTTEGSGSGGGAGDDEASDEDDWEWEDGHDYGPAWPPPGAMPFGLVPPDGLSAEGTIKRLQEVLVEECPRSVWFIRCSCCGHRKMTKDHATMRNDDLWVCRDCLKKTKGTGHSHDNRTKID